jgi:hypothetical protein
MPVRVQGVETQTHHRKNCPEQMEPIMSKTALLAAFGLMSVPLMAEAKGPIFAAECNGGVNQGGYNIDADAKGHPWVNGHRVNLTELAPGNWEGGYHGVMFNITQDSSGVFIAWSNARGEDGVCDVTAAPVSDGGE